MTQFYRRKTGELNIVRTEGSARPQMLVLSFVIEMWQVSNHPLW